MLNGRRRVECTATSIVSIVLIAGSPGVWAQSTTVAGDPQFEVASIRPNRSGSEMVSQEPMPNGNFSATNITLVQLVGIAWQFDTELIEAPAWATKDRFDVVAKGNAGSRTAFGTPAMYHMLRSLLVERFNLVVHPASRTRSIFLLHTVRADKKLGAHLNVSTATCPANDLKAIDGRPIFQFGWRPRCGIAMGFGDISAGGMPLSALAHAITIRLHRSLRDDTGLPGRYDFDLEFTPDEVLALAASRPVEQVPRAVGRGGKEIDPNGPSIMTALREQLGLKMDSETGAAEVLVIDHAERPAPD